MNASANDLTGDYLTRMVEGWHRFKGKSLLVISSNDLVVKEFLLFMSANAGRRRLLLSPLVERVNIAYADQMFYRSEWQPALEELCAEWPRQVPDKNTQQ